MSQNLETIRLLMAHDSQDSAEQLINLLRNAGRATRAQLVLNEDQLLQELKSGSWEVFVCRPSFGGCDYTTAIGHLQRLGKSPCTIVLTDDFSAETQLAVLKAGAQGASPLGNKDLLLLTIDQQLETIRLRKELQQNEIDLHDAEKRLNVLMDQTRDAIAYAVDGMHIHANDAYLEMFGYESADDLAGVTIMDLVSSDDQENLKKLLRNRAQDENQTHELSCKGKSQNGDEFEANFTFSLSTFDDEECTQIVIRTQEGMDEDTLRKITQTDATTGLPNRDWLLDALDQALSKTVNEGQGYAVYYLRIDDFEKYQGQFGIEGADSLIKQVANALSSQSNGAPLARVSSEEFALIEPCNDPDDASNRADDLRQYIGKLMPEVASRTLNITTTLGVAFTREDSRNSQSILSKALECCNKARIKNNGQGNTLLVHNPLDDLKAGSPEAIALRLQQALENNALQLQYQGIMNLADESDHFFEVFVKLPQEDGTVLEPSQFMPVAGEHGFASKIDRWVALTSMKKAASLSEKPRLLINLSGHSLRDKDLAAWLGKAIQATKLNPGNIYFQLSEGDANTFLKQAAIFAKAIQNIGCHFSISRFAGSINPLKLFDHIPAQCLKFEASFTKELSSKEQRDKFVELIKAAKADANREILVGFVESAEQMQHLWALGGINYLQGFYLQQPAEQPLIEAEE